MFIKDERARPTVTILKNTSSSPIVINRLGRGNARDDMKEEIFDLDVHDSWDHPVGHPRRAGFDPDRGQLNEEDC